jgi:hypothetical protein
MLLREVTEHGSSELEACRLCGFRLRLEERRTLLHEHPNTAAQHAPSTPVASQPSVPTPTAKAADDLADQLQSVRITGGATSSSHRTTHTRFRLLSFARLLRQGSGLIMGPTPTPAAASGVSWVGTHIRLESERSARG